MTLYDAASNICQALARHVIQCIWNPRFSGKWHPVTWRSTAGRPHLDYRHAADNSAEHGVLAVEKRRGFQRDEKLRPVGARPGVRAAHGVPFPDSMPRFARSVTVYPHTLAACTFLAWPPGSSSAQREHL